MEELIKVIKQKYANLGFDRHKATYIMSLSMPLNIKLEDFNGEAIATLDDNQGLLNPLINYCHQHLEDFKVIKYIDLYDDTTFNSLMVRDMLDDLQCIFTQAFLLDANKMLLLNQLKELCLRVLEEPHLFIKFYGD